MSGMTSFVEKPRSQNSKFKKKIAFQIPVSTNHFPKFEIIPSTSRKVIASERFPLFLWKQQCSKLKKGVKKLSNFQNSMSQ